MDVEGIPVTTEAEPREGLITITSPLTGEPVGNVPYCTPADMAEAARRARAEQPAWAARSFAERAAVITRFHDLILDRRDELFETLQAESGKSRRDAFVELFAVAAEARYYAYHGGSFLEPRRVRPAIPLRDVTEVIYRPVGVVGIISPWNFPFILSAGDAIPALLAGNAVIVKPASATPLTAMWMANALVQAGLPPAMMQVITGPGGELGDALVDNVDYVMFTGSTDVGRQVAERAARRLIPSSMELGGKNAMIVLPDANLQHAARVAIEAAYNNAGQVCINIERLYVVEEVYDAFVGELVAQIQSLRLGCDPSYDTDIGSLISEAQLQTVDEHVRDAVARGARVLAGGRARPDIGPLFYEPTLLEGVPAGAVAHREETFGPVLSVYRVGSLEEAIHEVNDSRYGLYHIIATRNHRRGKLAAARLNAGTVAINDSYMGWAAMDAPMGGFGESGLGRRHGADGIRKYTEPQTILLNRTPWQIGSGETALAINQRTADLLAGLLKLWRRIPFLR